MLNLNAEANATDTNLSFDSSKIETEAPKIELSLSSLYQNADEVVKGVIYILVLFSILAWAVFISKCRRKNKISIWKNKTSIKVEILFFYKP